MDAFIARKLPDLVQVAEVWIRDDSRRRSRYQRPASLGHTQVWRPARTEAAAVAWGVDERE